MKHRWRSTHDYPCWCGGWHTLREAWRMNRAHAASSLAPSPETEGGER